jgi:xanthine dehydrogenase YagS FAD-binding subunit
VEGYGRYNAILGASPDCVATHPSDLAVALTALDADVVVLGMDGERRLPVEELHRLPGSTPDRETELKPGELIVAVELPDRDPAEHSTYCKVRDRASYAFALVSVAAALRMSGRHVEDVRIAWGGVALKPWRARTLEAALAGSQLTEKSIRDAVDRELADASPGEESAYKLPLLRNTTVNTLTGLAEESA